jgi:hypothetical protein
VALPPAPVFDAAEVEAARVLARSAAPGYDAARGGLLVRAVKRVANLLGAPFTLPQRRFNAAVAARLVALEQSTRDALAFIRMLRDELTLQRAVLDGVRTDLLELRQRLERAKDELPPPPPREPR